MQISLRLHHITSHHITSHNITSHHITLQLNRWWAVFA